MELELHQLDLRYEALRRRSPRRERHLLASLAELGQQLPIVVVEGGEGGRCIVIDGYKRVRALRKLAKDTVRATAWQVEEAEALLLDRLMRTAESEGALEQGWLLRELKTRFSLSREQLAQRFDKSKSWVSRRLALVADLPMEIQERVREGAWGARGDEVSGAVGARQRGGGGAAGEGNRPAESLQQGAGRALVRLAAER